MLVRLRLFRLWLDAAYTLSLNRNLDLSTWLGNINWLRDPLGCPSEISGLSSTVARVLNTLLRGCLATHLCAVLGRLRSNIRRRLWYLHPGLLAHLLLGRQRMALHFLFNPFLLLIFSDLLRKSENNTSTFMKGFFFTFMLTEIKTAHLISYKSSPWKSLTFCSLRPQTSLHFIFISCDNHITCIVKCMEKKKRDHEFDLLLFATYLKAQIELRHIDGLWPKPFTDALAVHFPDGKGELLLRFYWFCFRNALYEAPHVSISDDQLCCKSIIQPPPHFMVVIVFSE